MRRGNNHSDRDVRSNFLSMVDASKNAAYNRRYSSDNNSLNLGGTLDYTGFKRLLLGRYNLFGIALSLTQRINYSRQSDDNQVTDYDSSAKLYYVNSKLSNQNKREIFEYTPSLTLSKNFSKFSGVYYRSLNVQGKVIEDFKNDNNNSSIANRNLERSFAFFRYEGNINYQYQRQQKYMYNLSAGYIKNFQYPSIDQLYTVVDDINVYDIRIGNPFLKNRINHTTNVNANFNTQKPSAVYSFNGRVGGSFTRTLNPVVDSTINEASGRRVNYYVNGDKSSNLSLNYNFNVSRKLKKNSIQLMYDGRFSKGRQPNYVDAIYNTSETVSLFNNINLQYTLRSILVLNMGKAMQNYTTTQTAAGLRSFKNSNNSTRWGAVLNYPANFTFSSTVDHVNNSNLAEPTILWNSFASYRFMKQQAELKLSAMDILKQYQNISNSAGAYGTITRITNGLQQFFLLTFSYYPRKFGKTEIKKVERKMVY